MFVRVRYLATAVLLSISLSLPESSAAQAAPPEIARECAAKWGTNYRMQIYCREKQMEALTALKAQDAATAERIELYPDAVAGGILSAKKAIKLGGLKGLNRELDDCYKHMLAYWQYQRCLTIASFAMFEADTKTGTNSPNETAERSWKEGRRVFGSIGARNALDWIGTISGMVTASRL